MPLKIAIATSDKYPELFEDDRYLLPAFQSMGMQTQSVIWDQETDWTQFDAVVLRSVWDYWEKYDQFIAWLSHLERHAVRLFNPAPFLRENTNKVYLKDFGRQGIPMLPTQWVEQGARPSLEQILSELGWSEAVIKPGISAGAFRTHRVRRGTPGAQALLEEITQTSSAMIQPFLPEIFNGELSMIYYGGEFSHAVVKRGPLGEFRVQLTFGGSVTPVTPSAKAHALAERVLKLAPNDLLYARVDMVERDGEYLLMELEGVEPHLYFGYDPEAPSRFAYALQRLFEKSKAK